MNKIYQRIYNVIILLGWVTALLYMSSSANAFQINAEIENSGEYLQQWVERTASPKETLVLLDLDDTAIATPLEKWVRPNIFYHLRTEYMEKHPELQGTPEEKTKKAGDALDQVLVPLFLRLPYELTDSSLPEAINVLKTKGIKVLGFTARENGVVKETLATLNKLNLSFSKDVLDDGVVPMANEHPLYIKDGVVFIGHGNTKGDALVQLIQSGKLEEPKSVLMIDDRVEHLEKTAASLSSFNDELSFIAILCTYPHNFKPYEEKPVKRELLNDLYELNNDPVIVQLLKTTPYAEELVKAQCQDQAPVQEIKDACAYLLPLVLQKHQTAANDGHYDNEKGEKAS